MVIWTTHCSLYSALRCEDVASVLDIRVLGGVPVGVPKVDRLAILYFCLYNTGTFSREFSVLLIYYFLKTFAHSRLHAKAFAFPHVRRNSEPSPGYPSTKPTPPSIGYTLSPDTPA